MQKRALQGGIRVLGSGMVQGIIYTIQQNRRWPLLSTRGFPLLSFHQLYMSRRPMASTTNIQLWCNCLNRMQLVNPSITTHSQLLYDYLVTKIDHVYGREGSNYRTIENPKAALPHLNSAACESAYKYQNTSDGGYL